MGFRILRPAVAVVAVLLLAGCLPPEPVVTPEPEPESAPVFASDEEALAAATEAYAQYLEVSDQILTEGGESPERLLLVATASWTEVQAEGFVKARTDGLHSVGRTTFDSFSIEHYDQTAIDGEAIIRAYVCIDVSEVDVLDSNGDSVVSSTRPDRSAAEVVFDWVQDPSQSLFVAGVESWEGRDFCA